MRIWRPRRDGWPRAPLPLWPNLVWWALDALGVFARRDCGVLMLLSGGRLVHSALVSPAWFRFPNMQRDDVQIGAVWTAPDMRGRGLARLGMQMILAAWARDGGRVWYIVEEDNTPSIRLAERAGFLRMGDGERSRPFGLGLLGRYRIAGQV
jgi:ribosomal protein S18 acetylase RimI-like enzyme